MRSRVRLLKRPKLREPIMIGGLPGIGHVAWLTTTNLLKALNAELFAEVLSPSFSPRVFLTEEGVVSLVKEDFYFWENDSGGHDLIIFSANEQPYSPEGQYEMAHVTVRMAKKLGVKMIITMGGMHVDYLPKTPKVYGGVTSVELLRELEGLGVLRLEGGTISGVNGLIFGLAKAYEIPAICLLTETPGYIAMDAAAAKETTLVLSRLLKMAIDVSGLERQAKENLEALKRAQEMSRLMAPPEQRKLAPERELTYVS